MAGTLIVLIIGGIVGAGESALTGQFLMGLFAPYLVPDKYQGAFFLGTVFLGAWAGVGVTPSVACLRRATMGLRLISGIVASLLGIPAGFMATGLLFGGGRGPWIGVTVYSVQLLLLTALLAWIHRETKAERARDDQAATTEGNERAGEMDC